MPPRGTQRAASALWTSRTPSPFASWTPFARSCIGAANRRIRAHRGRSEDDSVDVDDADEPEEPATWSGAPFPHWTNSLSRLGLLLLVGVIVGPFTSLWFWVRRAIH